ncbi:hypothetical protein HCN44_007744 [Aphidius gifuensis]|uniref:Uncharacterized protein n=1 Tax=Aphidius gifuensis TaxID=684658 RepID=A0A834XPW7_APHGI|nr:hypothetical protein HCN44_007744 [Aphidius gifuensis]
MSFDSEPCNSETVISEPAWFESSNDNDDDPDQFKIDIDHASVDTVAEKLDFTKEFSQAIKSPPKKSKQSINNYSETTLVPDQVQPSSSSSRKPHMNKSDRVMSFVKNDPLLSMVKRQQLNIKMTDPVYQMSFDSEPCNSETVISEPAWFESSNDNDDDPDQFKIDIDHASVDTVAEKLDFTKEFSQAIKSPPKKSKQSINNYSETSTSDQVQPHMDIRDTDSSCNYTHARYNQAQLILQEHDYYSKLQDDNNKNNSDTLLSEPLQKTTSASFNRNKSTSPTTLVENNFKKMTHLKIEALSNSKKNIVIKSDTTLLVPIKGIKKNENKENSQKAPVFELQKKRKRKQTLKEKNFFS